MTTAALIDRDLRHIWHPCTQMKDHETWPLFEIVAASGCYLELSDGRKIIDAISSWWCKSLGHQHPRIKHAVMQQVEKFEHVMLAGITNEVIVRLSEMLAALMPVLNKVLYAGDGSSAIEMALKLSLQAQNIAGHAQRTKFIALKNAYHGETAGAMSVSDLGIYRQPYQTMLFSVDTVSAAYVTGTEDPIWEDSGEHWQSVIVRLESLADTAAAVIVEPIVQGVGGMKIYSKDFLKRLRAWTSRHGIYLIADEIMTGLGRTGKMLACEHAGIVPDFLCLSKGLTAGWLPMSVTLTRAPIYDLFYDDYASGHSFLHSHTYSGNVLAASAAIETLTILRETRMLEQVAVQEQSMRSAMDKIAHETGLLKNVRALGGIAAAELNVADAYERAGMKVYHEAMRLGACLRPLGNTIYWLPPFIISNDEIDALANITREAVNAALCA